MSSFSEWMASDTSASAVMGLDDPYLPSRTAELKHRQETLLAESRRLDRMIAEANRVVAEARGTGTSERGAVTVVVDAQNRVVDIQLTPRALRFASTDRLREALLEACDAALVDVGRQMAEAIGVDPAGDPLAAMISSLPGLSDVLPPITTLPARAPRPSEESR